MPPVTLIGDLCSGHGCFPPRPSTQGEPRFTVGGRSVVLVGHAFAAHSCKTTHAGALAAGAARFTVGGRGLGRVGDAVDCGSTVAQGEQRFLVGGG